MSPGSRCSVSSHNLYTHITVRDPGSCFPPGLSLPCQGAHSPSPAGGWGSGPCAVEETDLADIPHPLLSKRVSSSSLLPPVCSSPSATQRLPLGSQCGVHPLPPGSWLLPRAREERSEEDVQSPGPSPAVQPLLGTAGTPASSPERRLFFLSLADVILSGSFFSAAQTLGDKDVSCPLLSNPVFSRALRTRGDQPLVLPGQWFPGSPRCCVAHT